MLLKTLKIGNLSIQVPIIQGGMGVGISLSGLASAVANEGGVGVISAAGLGIIYKNLSKNYLEASILGLKEELSKARQKTQGVIGVNIMVALSNFADLVRTAIAEKADIIFAGAGMPLNLPSFLQKDSTTKLVPIVSSGRAAKLICEKWKSIYNYLPDALVVEGPKAGGHLGFSREQLDEIDTMDYDEEIRQIIACKEEYEKRYEKKIPVIVAGGIFDRADIDHALELGADGVQIASRFVATEECDASEAYKQAYINAKEEDVQIIQSPVGMPGRAIDGEFIQSVEKGNETPKNCPFHCIKTCDYTKSPYCIVQCLYQAARGNMKKGYAFTGINVHLSEKISSVKEVISNLKAEFLNAKLEGGV